MKYALALLLVVGLLLVTSMALAQAGGTYDLTWNTIDGGGHTSSSGGTYVLDGTIGQPDAGVMNGGTYVLGGGFWMGGEVQEPALHCIYLPIIVRQAP
jgi:hypothetical protein